MSRKARLVFQPDLNGRRAGGNDEGLGAHGLFAIDCDRERTCCELNSCDIAGEELRPESLRLCPHFFHQLRAHDALGKARIVLNFRRRGQLSAGLPAFNEQGREIRPRRIDRGGQAGWAGTNDDDVAHEQNLTQRVRECTERGEEGYLIGGGMLPSLTSAR
ncbi:MAG: hypothetical protein EWM73_03732 [Nitrospira sp.]|nr:MAG: hypothetical protein EWM73_03732 [Nitrospira sp.]